MELMFILKFLVLTAIITAAIGFFLRSILISSTESSVNRLNEEIKKTNEKQAELARRLKEADEELAKRRAEAKELADKMRADAEAESKAEREKIIAKARSEGEEIIAKAQGAKEKIRADLEKELDVRVINYSMKILNEILSDKAKGTLNEMLVKEFIDNLKTVDMSRIGPEVKTADVITLSPIDDGIKRQFASLLKEKLNRDITINTSTDEKLGGGVMLKFGSLALDGTIKNLIRESALGLKEVVEAKT